MTTASTEPTSESMPAVGSALVARLADLIGMLASWRVWIVSASAFVVVAGLLFGSSAPFAIPQVEAACGQPPPDVRFTSSAADVSRFLDACGEVGRGAYRSMQVADLLYPLVFGLFLATSLALALTHLAPRRPALAALAVVPLIGTVFDYLENASAWLALAAYPEPSITAPLLGLASAAKTIAFWCSGLALLGAVAMLAVRSRRRHHPPGPAGGVIGSDEVA